jgi:hypothetical protein
MTPEEAQIVRVFTRGVGTTVPDSTITLDAAKQFEVVVEAEAGQDLVGLGVNFTLTVDAFDFTRGENPKDLEPGFSKTVTAPFIAQVTQLFTVTVIDSTNVKNHVFMYTAMLIAGSGAQTVASFAQSPLFTIIA